MRSSLAHQRSEDGFGLAGNRRISGLGTRSIVSGESGGPAGRGSINLVRGPVAALLSKPAFDLVANCLPTTSAQELDVDRAIPDRDITQAGQN